MRIMNNKKIFLYSIFLIAVVMLIACKSKNTYLENEYSKLQQNTELLFNRVLSLMDSSQKPFHNYEEQVEQVLEDLEVHYETTKSLPDTEFILSQWDILLGEEVESLLIVTYFNKWREKKTMDEHSIAIGKSNVRLGILNIMAAETELAELKFKQDKKKK